MSPTGGKSAKRIVTRKSGSSEKMGKGKRYCKSGGKPSIKTVKRYCNFGGKSANKEFKKGCNSKLSNELLYEESIFLTYLLKNNNTIPTNQDFHTVDKLVRKLIKILNKPRKLKKHTFKHNLFKAIHGLNKSRKKLMDKETLTVLNNGSATESPNQHLPNADDDVDDDDDQAVAGCVQESPPIISVDVDLLDPSLFELLDNLKDYN